MPSPRPLAGRERSRPLSIERLYQSGSIGLPVFTFCILLPRRQPSRRDEHGTFVYSFLSRRRAGNHDRAHLSRDFRTRRSSRRRRHGACTRSSRRAARTSATGHRSWECRPAAGDAPRKPGGTWQPVSATSLRAKNSRPIPALQPLSRRFWRAAGRAAIPRRLRSRTRLRRL